MNAGYEATFLAIGTHKSKRLGVEGEDLDGVIHAAGFLHDMGIGKKVVFKDKIVAVIGGGNVAIDSVRTAVRLGAKSAFVIYRRSRAEIPAKKCSNRVSLKSFVRCTLPGLGQPDISNKLARLIHLIKSSSELIDKSFFSSNGTF